MDWPGTAQDQIGDLKSISMQIEILAHNEADEKLCIVVRGVSTVRYADS